MLCLRTEIMHEAHCHLGLFEKVAASSGLPVGVSIRSKIIKCINSFVQELGQQVSSELHVPAQRWAYEAGVSEEAGRVMEPRNMYSRGHEDSLSGIAAKADGVHAPEGSNPVCDSGECTGHHRGLRAGHVFRGVTRELGRTPGLRV